jgi:hypothetical protein
MDSMASGGIIAFAGPDGSEVKDPDPDLEYLDLAEKQRKAAYERAGIVGGPNAKMKDYLAEQVGALPGRTASEKGLMMMDYFSNLGTQTGPLGYAALKAARETTPSFRTGLQNIRKAQEDVTKCQNTLEQADRLEAQGLVKEANELRRYAEDRLSRENIASVKGGGNMTNYAQNYLQERITAGDKRDPAAILREGMNEYMSLYGAAGSRAATAATVASGNIRDKAVDNVTTTLTKDFNSPEAKQIRKLQKEDKANGTNTAQTYKDSLIKKEMNRIQSPTPAKTDTGGDGGSSKKSKVINLDNVQ